MNPETRLTLDDCVNEVLGLLTGLDLQYAPEMDRYQAIVRQLNRAMRAMALEKEWSCYASTEVAGTATFGQREVVLRSSVRPRMVNDDAVRLVDSRGNARVWAYFLPRDAIHKYGSREGLWVSVTGQRVLFSRPLLAGEAGLEIHVPVMREPKMFRLPPRPEDPEEEIVDVPEAVRNQPLDFMYPDLVTLRAAFYYAQSDPVMQPRVQTLEAQYKDLMYQVIERDDRMTDSPYLNDFTVPVQSGLREPKTPGHWHPHADERR